MPIAVCNDKNSSQCIFIEMVAIIQFTFTQVECFNPDELLCKFMSKMYVTTAFLIEHFYSKPFVDDNLPENLFDV